MCVVLGMGGGEGEREWNVSSKKLKQAKAWHPFSSSLIELPCRLLALQAIWVIKTMIRI